MLIILPFQTVGETIQCSVCRSKQQYHDISYIKAQAGNTVSDEECKKIKGHHSTKMEAVIKVLFKLLSEDPKVKVIMFSFWVSILKGFEKALLENDIRCELVYNNSQESKIESFKVSCNGLFFFTLTEMLL